MENGSIVEALDDSFSVNSCSSDGVSSSSSSDSESCFLNRHIRYRRRRLRRNSDGDDIDRLFTSNNISNCGSFVLIDSSKLISECRNQHLCAHYESNMDCVRLKRRRSSDTSIGSGYVELRPKDQQSFFRRGCAAIRNSFSNRSSKRFRYMKSVSLSMAQSSTDQNNNRNGSSSRMCRSYNPQNHSDSDRSSYRRYTYVRSFSSSTGCITTSNDDERTTEQIG